MKKPRIKIFRNFRGEATWQCVGFSSVPKRHALIGRGRTPEEAYIDWQAACDFPLIPK